MKIFPKRKTDEECIESIRKYYKRRWWICIPLLLFFLLIFASSLYMGNKFEKQCIKMFNEISNIDPAPVSKENIKENLQQTATALSYYFGFRIGFVSAQGITASMLGICLSFNMFFVRRKDIMLLKYYDENKPTSKT